MNLWVCFQGVTQILISFLSAKQRPVIPLELLHQEHNLEQSCRTAAQDPAFPWGGCMPSQFPGVCRVGLSCLRATSSSVLEGCPGTVLLDTAPAAHTQCPHTPNFAFPSPPATAELTDGCTNLLCRCLGCLRRAFHPSSSEMYL